MAMAASSVSAAAPRVDLKSADPELADLSLEIGVASCCFVTDTPTSLKRAREGSCKVCQTASIRAGNRVGGEGDVEPVAAFGGVFQARCA
jgi:hypothetical protein